MNHSALISVVNKGQAKRVMEKAREAGASGGTICLARGTASTSILAALGFADSAREVLFSIIGENQDGAAIYEASVKAKAKGMAMLVDTDEEGTMNTEWKLIEVICEEGYSDDIMATARKAGARGGTVINAHGTCTEDDIKFFGSPLVPEKEILMIVVTSDIADAVIDSISSMEILKKKGMGVIFSLPVKSFTTLG